MASAIQDVPDQEFNGIRYTGFPEPLSLHRNTTLPHPDANLSPDACIESFDLPLARSSSRLRFSSSRRVSSKGFIDPKQVYENVLYVDSTTTVNPKPGSSSSSKDSSGSPSLDSDAGFKSTEEAGRRRSSLETDSSERHDQKKGGLRGLFHKG
ncbi:hypothetical protein VE03_01946 [Pseudogymnoascus sp. 23342-1-I1]|nr:hypothetical protein VE03_01946 [Pseudogymnoascus sp. 23342-1-I1]